jgi:transcriptional regulator with XRE-family HTH domain
MHFPNELIQLDTLETARKLFGRRLRTAREAKELTQKDVGKLIGRAPNTVAMIERGEQAPEWDALEAIFEKLGEPPAYYFSEERAPLPKEKPTPEEALAVLAEVAGIARAPKIIIGKSADMASLLERLASLDDAKHPLLFEIIRDYLAEADHYARTGQYSPTLQRLADLVLTQKK